jgi:hypothetical protein
MPMISRTDHCWTLSLNNLGPNGDSTYELQVRHSANDDSFRFVRWEMGDSIELVTKGEYGERRDAIVENEGHGPCSTQDCNNPDGASVRYGYCLPVCDVCAAKLDTSGFDLQERKVLDESDARARADAWLSDKVVVATMQEQETLTLLRRTWDAFAVLFNPSVTL